MTRLLDAVQQGEVEAALRNLPGAEVVEVRKPDDGHGETVPAPLRPGQYSLSALAQCARDVADRLRAHQARLVDAGLRGAPYPARMGEADMLDRLAQLADRVRTDGTIMERLRALGRSGGAS